MTETTVDSHVRLLYLCHPIHCLYAVPKGATYILSTDSGVTPIGQFQSMNRLPFGLNRLPCPQN